MHRKAAERPRTGGTWTFRQRGEVLCQGAGTRKSVAGRPLEQPGPPLHDDATAEQLRELITKGALGGLVLIADDVRALYETLRARGVTDFTQEPVDHFYGTDMSLRDPFGNTIRILQQGTASQEATT